MRALLERGLSYHATARRMGRNYRTVAVRAKRWGFGARQRRRPFTLEGVVRESIARDLAAGRTLAETAKRAGVSPSTLKRAMRQDGRGLRSYAGVMRPSDDARAWALHSEGMAVGEIARRMGRDRATIRSALERVASKGAE